MSDRKTICILGGTGTVGMAAYKVLRKSDYHFRIGVRDKVKLEKECLYIADNVPIFEIDLDRPNNYKNFYSGADLVIGAIGPSTRYSEKMLQVAMETGVPYIDPGGMHLRKKYSNTEMDTMAIVGAGLFPGLSGWLLYSKTQEADEKQLFEIVIGGKYNFSNSSVIDYIEEIKSSVAGVPMSCIRNGVIVPAEKIAPKNVPGTLSELTFLPYITEEIQEILSSRKTLNIDAYTAAPARSFAVMKNLYEENEDAIKFLAEEKYANERAVIWIRETCQNGIETIFFHGSNPGELTGKILAISATAILHSERSRGIFSMANYLRRYPLLEKLKNIDDFVFERSSI